MLPVIPIEFETIDPSIRVVSGANDEKLPVNSAKSYLECQKLAGTHSSTPKPATTSTIKSLLPMPSSNLATVSRAHMVAGNCDPCTTNENASEKACSSEEAEKSSVPTGAEVGLT